MPDELLGRPSWRRDRNLTNGPDMKNDFIVVQAKLKYKKDFFKRKKFFFYSEIPVIFTNRVFICLNIFRNKPGIFRTKLQYE